MKGRKCRCSNGLTTNLCVPSCESWWALVGDGEWVAVCTHEYNRDLWGGFRPVRYGEPCPCVGEQLVLAL